MVIGDNVKRFFQAYKKLLDCGPENLKPEINKLLYDYLTDKIPKRTFKREVTNLYQRCLNEAFSDFFDLSEHEDGLNANTAFFDCLRYMTNPEDAAIQWNSDAEIVKILLNQLPTLSPKARREVKVPKEVKQLREL